MRTNVLTDVEICSILSFLPTQQVDIIESEDDYLRNMNLSRRDIEHMAEAMIWDYYGNKPLWVLPIDICKMATDYLKLTLMYEKLSGAILGVTAYKDTQLDLHNAGEVKTITLAKHSVLIDEELKNDKGNQGRFRFTVAHECAHQVFFKLYGSQADYEFRKWCADNNNPQQLSMATKWNESKANELAAALLMPIPMMERLSIAFGVRSTFEKAAKI